MKLRASTSCALLLVMLSSALGLQAGLLPVYTNEASFLAKGNITESTNFDSFTDPVTEPGDNFTLGSVTYTNSQNVIVAPSFGLGNTRSLMANNSWTPLTGNIANNYSLFGLRLGRLAVEAQMDPYTFSTLSSTINATLTTNLGSYDLKLYHVPINSEGTKFFGFVLDDPTEHFTSFEFSSEDYFGNAPAMTDVQLGAKVPDTTISLSLFACVLAALLPLSRRLRVKA